MTKTRGLGIGEEDSGNGGEDAGITYKLENDMEVNRRVRHESKVERITWNLK